MDKCKIDFLIWKMYISSPARPALVWEGDQGGLRTPCVALYQTLGTEGICAGNGGKEKAPLILFNLVFFFGSPYLPLGWSSEAFWCHLSSGEKCSAFNPVWAQPQAWLWHQTHPVGYDEKCGRWCHGGMQWGMLWGQAVQWVMPCGIW